MPIYEYDCLACGTRFEELVLGSESPPCPSCGAKRIEKRFSAFAVGGASTPDVSPGGCGTCGDPRGPGACAMGDMD